MNPLLPALLTAGIPTLAVLIAILRNESAISALAARITTLEQRMDLRFSTVEHRMENLDRDLRDWAKITMAHNTDIARLKDKAGLE